MNAEQFIAGFQNPKEILPCGEIISENPVGEVTIAGTVLAATKELFCIEVNGVQYEIAIRDVINIDDIASGKSEEAPEEKTEEREPAAKAGPRLVMIKLPSNAILHRQISVPAALVAAMGTWVNIVPVAPQAA